MPVDPGAPKGGKMADASVVSVVCGHNHEAKPELMGLDQLEVYPPPPTYLFPGVMSQFENLSSTSRLT